MKQIQYQVQKDTKIYFSFLCLLIFNKYTSFKGPGEYNPEKTMLLLEKALQFTFGLRTNIDRPNNIPGIAVKLIPLFASLILFRSALLT